MTDIGVALDEPTPELPPVPEPPADPAAGLREAVTGPTPPPAAPPGPDLSRWNFMNPSVALTVGASAWETGPPVTESGQPLPEFHQFAGQRAQRMGVNAVRSAEDPVAEAERLFGSGPTTLFSPASYPTSDSRSAPEETVGGRSNVPANLPGADNEVSPALALMTTQPRTEAYLTVPADRDLGVAGIAGVLDDGKNPIQTNPFLEALGQQYIQNLPRTHGEAVRNQLDVSAVLGFELSRWEYALDNFDMKGEDVTAARSAYAKLRSGDDLSEDETGTLVSSMLQFARQMEPFSSPELNTESLTAQLSGYNSDTGGVEFTVANWAGASLANLTSDEASTRLSKVAALHPSGLVPAMADNFDAFVKRREVTGTDGEVSPQAVTRVALGFSLDTDDDKVLSQVDLALNVAAARNGISPEQLAADISAKLGDEDTIGIGDLWLDGAGPGYLGSTSILDAILKPSYATGIPASAIALTVPGDMKRTTVKDFENQRGASFSPSEALVVAENADGTGSLLGERNGAPETLRGAYPTGLTDPDGRTIWLNRRPSSVAEAKAGVPGLSKSSDLSTVPAGARGRFYIAPPTAPVAFQPGVFIKIGLPPTMPNGTPAEQMSETLLARLAKQGVKPAKTGWEGAHREVTYAWQHPTTKQRLPDDTEEDVKGWDRVHSETPLRDFWMELSDVSQVHLAEQYLAAQEEAILGPDATRAYYVNGETEAPSGTVAQFERHMTDPMGGYSITVSGDGDGDAPDTAVVYVPQGASPSAGSVSGPVSFTGNGPSLSFAGASASASPGVTDLTPDDEAASLFDVTISQDGRKRKPDHAWVSFVEGGPVTIKYGTTKTAPAVGVGLHLKVNRGGPIEVAVDDDGTVDTAALDTAMSWLKANGIEGRLKEHAS